MSRYAVIGLGTFGMSLARALARLSAEVIAVDNDLANVEQVRDVVHTAVRMDARDPEALREQSIHEVDAAVVCMGEDFEASELCAVHLSELGCRRVLVRGTSRERVEILRALGSEVIMPGINAARKLAVQILSPGLVDFAHLDGPHDIGIVEVGTDHAGESIADLALEEKCKVKLLAIRRGGEKSPEILTGLAGSTEVRVGDRLYLLGAERDVIRAGGAFAGRPVGKDGLGSRNR